MGDTLQVVATMTGAVVLALVVGLLLYGIVVGGRECAKRFAKGWREGMAEQREEDAARQRESMQG